MRRLKRWGRKFSRVTRESNGSVKIAPDLVELNKQTMKKTMQMPILVDLGDQISMKISEGRGKPLLFSTIDLNYAFGKIRLHKTRQNIAWQRSWAGKLLGNIVSKKTFIG